MFIDVTNRNRQTDRRISSFSRCSSIIIDNDIKREKYGTGGTWHVNGIEKNA
jgi:hypothetical protein